MALILEEILEKYTIGDNEVYVNSFDTPVGSVCAAADDDYLYIVSFKDSKNLEKAYKILSQEIPCQFVMKENKILKQLKDEFTCYFKGKLKRFTVPIKMIGSDFQKEVWNKLMKLPFGSIRTYSDIAKDLGRETSHSRAIGTACGANAHIIVIPCHRIVASGSKGGFSCGLDRKEWLLEHEKKYTI